MRKFRKRPKGGYIQEADREALYELTQHWNSELLFYKDDLRFLRHLIDKYFVWMIQRENLDTVRELELDLLETNIKCKDLLQKVNKHLEQLAETNEGSKKEEARIFRLEHAHLEDEIVNFERMFRVVRKDVFAVTEHVIESEAMLHLKTLKSSPISA